MKLFGFIQKFKDEQKRIEAEVKALSDKYAGKKIVKRVIEIDFYCETAFEKEYEKTITEIRKRRFGFRPYEIVWGDWGVTKFHNLNELTKLLELLSERPEFSGWDDDDVIYVYGHNDKIEYVNDGTGWVSDYAFEDAAPTWDELKLQILETIKKRQNKYKLLARRVEEL